MVIALLGKSPQGSSKIHSWKIWCVENGGWSWGSCWWIALGCRSWLRWKMYVMCHVCKKMCMRPVPQLASDMGYNLVQSIAIALLDKSPWGNYKRNGWKRIKGLKHIGRKYRELLVYSTGGKHGLGTLEIIICLGESKIYKREKVCNTSMQRNNAPFVIPKGRYPPSELNAKCPVSSQFFIHLPFQIE